MQQAPDPSALRRWFVPERPGPLVGLHVLQTGHGTCYVDRWPDPNAALAQTADNYELVGDPDALEPTELRRLIVGFLAADERFDPLLQQAFPSRVVWPRVISERPLEPIRTPPADGAVIRRLGADDAAAIGGLSPEVNWIAKTWDGPNGLAASGFGWGAFVDGRLVAVACSFFVAEHFEDVGVVTEPEFRGRGLSVACTAGLCNDVVSRGRRPSWTTSPDNRASLRVAEKLGFKPHRTDRLLVVGRDVPATASGS